MNDRLISIVVPVFNEEAALDVLAAEIRLAAKRDNLNIQIVFVDDGSADRSWARISALAAADPSIGGIRFRTNAGKAAALMAGFAAARGELVFMMDADLQDPPHEIPRFIQEIDKGYDLVSGWKRVRHDPWHKVYPSRVFNRLIGMLTGVHLHDHVCGFKCLRREVARRIRIHGELHRFIAVFASANGFRVAEIATEHRPRTTGYGKYGVSRFAKGFLDLITVLCLTRFRWRPQHLIGVTGLTLSLAIALLLLVSFGRLFVLIPIVMPAVALTTIGLVAELIVTGRPLDELYDVAECVGWCAGETEAAEGGVNDLARSRF